MIKPLIFHNIIIIFFIIFLYNPLIAYGESAVEATSGIEKNLINPASNDLDDLPEDDFLGNYFKNTFMSNGWGFLRLFGVLIGLPLLLLLLLKYLAKKKRYQAAGINMQIRGVLPFDSNRYIAAVEIDGQLLIIGVSSNGLSSLAQWPVEKTSVAKKPTKSKGK